MDNRIFNVNGRGDEMLLSALELVFQQSGTRTLAAAWMFKKTHGMILCWYKEESTKGVIPFPDKLTAAEVMPIVSKWLKGEQAATVPALDWDKDCDHDGHNSAGWRVYCEDWGHVADSHAAICAIKPVYIWHGK